MYTSGRGRLGPHRHARPSMYLNEWHAEYFHIFALVVASGGLVGGALFLQPTCCRQIDSGVVMCMGITWTSMFRPRALDPRVDFSMFRPRALDPRVDFSMFHSRALDPRVDFSMFRPRALDPRVDFTANSLDAGATVADTSGQHRYSDRIRIKAAGAHLRERGTGAARTGHACGRKRRYRRATVGAQDMAGLHASQSHILTSLPPPAFF